MVRIQWVDAKTTWSDEPTEATRNQRPPAGLSTVEDGLSFEDDVTADYVPLSDLESDPTLVDAPAFRGGRG